MKPIMDNIVDMIVCTAEADAIIGNNENGRKRD